VALVERCGASLHVLHVLEEVVGAERSNGESARAPSSSARSNGVPGMICAASSRVATTRESMRNWRSSGTCRLRGSCDNAESHAIDLIAIGRHGRGRQALADGECC